MSEKEFVDEIIVEFIKYAFDNSQEKHPLRYYVPYGVDENNDGRMLYTRLLKYCQKYRDQEYEEFKRKGTDIEELKAKSMQTMDEKREGYSITPTIGVRPHKETATLYRFTWIRSATVAM